MLHRQNFETGFERVGNFERPWFLDPGFGVTFFEHIAHVWKGNLPKKESEETRTKDFQVICVGSWQGFSSRVASSSFGRRYKSPALRTTTRSGVPSLLSLSSKRQQQLVPSVDAVVSGQVS